MNKNSAADAAKGERQTAEIEAMASAAHAAKNESGSCPSYSASLHAVLV